MTMLSLGFCGGFLKPLSYVIISFSRRVLCYREVLGKLQILNTTRLEQFELVMNAIDETLPILLFLQTLIVWYPLICNAFLFLSHSKALHCSLEEHGGARILLLF